MRKSGHDYATARRLRREMTLPEVLLWRHLRQAPVKFRRQHPVGPFVLDFYCASAKLAIEVDGAAHDRGDRPERDERRDHFLTEQAMRVVRVPARDVLRDAARVAESIVELCLADRSCPLHHPSRDGPPPHPLGGRGG